jgi:hypothetical protein
MPKVNYVNVALSINNLMLVQKAIKIKELKPSE